jgi:ribosomal-protein-alanine N-acetyltransferase
VILRPATVEDVPAVLSLERAAFGVDAWSEASVREELTGPRRVSLVACDPGVVGYVVTASAGDVVDLQRIAVHPRRRRHGLARSLLALVCAQADEDRMMLEVAAGNAPARAFYAAEGFTEVGRRRGYYRDGSDAVVMERALPASARPAASGENDLHDLHDR